MLVSEPRVQASSPMFGQNTFLIQCVSDRARGESDRTSSVPMGPIGHWAQGPMGHMGLGPMGPTGLYRGHGAQLPMDKCDGGMSGAKNNHP